MARTVNEGILEMLEAIYEELKSIKKQFKPKSEIKELKERLDILENKVSMLETWKTIDKPLINPYQPPIMFGSDVPPSSPLFPQVMGNSNTENISNLSKEIDDTIPNIVNKPHIAKEFKK